MGRPGSVMQRQILQFPALPIRDPNLSKAEYTSKQHVVYIFSPVEN
jgi:hypothetical protein